MRMTRMLGPAALVLFFFAAISVAPVRAMDTVTIGTVGSPSANLWPVFIGIDKGFFAAQNVKADVVGEEDRARGGRPGARQLLRGTSRKRHSAGLRQKQSGLT